MAEKKGLKKSDSQNVGRVATTKKKPLELTFEKKIELLKFVEENSERKAAERFNVSKGTVCNIKKRKKELMEMLAENTNLKRGRLPRKTDYVEINNDTWTWFQRMRSINVRVSGPMIQKAALTFAQKHNRMDFRASNGWLDKFKNRHNIHQKVISSDSNDVDSAIGDFIQALPHFCAGYKVEDIFNADETGIFYRAMPDKTLATLTDLCKDGKLAKERLTVLLCVSATGEKLRPLVIGKTIKPRCFKNFDVKQLPAVWHAHPKAWMRLEIFADWLHTINKEFKVKNRKILLFIDNCPAHQIVELTNVKVMFFPANTTSVIQPMEQGIIRVFKSLYRRHFLRYVIANFDNAVSNKDIVKSITVMDAILWIIDAWNGVRSEAISKCFKKSGFEKLETTEYPEDEDVPLQQLMEQARAEHIVINVADVTEFVNFDGGIATFANFHDPAIESAISRASAEAQYEDESDCDMEMPVSDKEVLASLAKVRQYSLANNVDSLFDIAAIEGKVHAIILERKKQAAAARFSQEATPIGAYQGPPSMMSAASAFLGSDGHNTPVPYMAKPTCPI